MILQGKAKFVGCIFLKVILDNFVLLRDIAKLIHQGKDRAGRLFGCGLASDSNVIPKIIKEE